MFLTMRGAVLSSCSAGSWIVASSTQCAVPLIAAFAISVPARCPAQTLDSNRAVAVRAAEHAAWLQEFRGLVTVWRCCWLMDKAGVSMPTAMTIDVTEHRVVEQGYERLTVTWKPPYRTDLTPTVAYFRLTNDECIVANGNNHGPRAVLHRSAGYRIEQTSLYTLIADPLAALAPQDFRQSTARILWSRAIDKSDANAPNVVNGELGDGRSGTAVFVGQHIDLEGHWSQVQAHSVRFANNTLSSDGLSAGGSENDVLRWPVLALDVSSHRVDAARPDRDANIESSYRAIDIEPRSQAIDAPQNAVPVYPRLLLWEQIYDRPNQPQSDFHSLKLMLIRVEANPDHVLTDWTILLPKMRIIEPETGKAWMNKTTRDDCGTWSFIKRVSQASAEFEELLSVDLRNRYPNHLLPIARALPLPQQDLGALRKSAPFLAIPALATKRTDQGTIDQALLGPMPADNKTKVPRLLGIVDDIRIAMNKGRTAHKHPRRAGRVPVTVIERRLAQRKLTIILASVLTTAIATLSIISWRRLRWRVRTVVAASPVIVLILQRVVVAADHVDLRAPMDIADSISNTGEVQDLVRACCDRSASDDSLSQEHTLWDTVLQDHRRIREKLALYPPNASVSSDSERTRSMLSALETYYGSISVENRKAATTGGPRDIWREELATGDGADGLSHLHSVFQRRKANCFSLSLLYFLHCRLANIDLRMLAVPRHAMLCRVDSPRIANRGPEPLVEIYDPVRRRWLTPEEIRRVSQSTYCVLQTSQISAIFLYNCGTELCKQRHSREGAQLLEGALQRGFPFSDVIKNLGLAYYEHGRFDAVVSLIESRIGWYDSDHDSAHPNQRSKFGLGSETTTRDITILYAQCLLRVGRVVDAIAIIEGVIIDDGSAIDFLLYKSYLALKSSPGDKHHPQHTLARFLQVGHL